MRSTNLGFSGKTQGNMSHCPQWHYSVGFRPRSPHPPCHTEPEKTFLVNKLSACYLVGIKGQTDKASNKLVKKVEHLAASQELMKNQNKGQHAYWTTFIN